MTTYTTVAVTGYDATSPPDDGSQTSTNLITWSGFKTQLTGPLKTALESINSQLVSINPLGPDSLQVSNNVLCPHKGLSILYASAATVTVAATSVLLSDSSGNQKLFTSLSVTPSLASSGAGGLDTGAEASGTWYYIWAIGKSDGTKSVVFSTSSSAPQLPSGYTYYGLLGAVRNDGSSNLIATAQIGDTVTRASQAGTAAGTDTSFTAVGNATAGVPPIAKKAHLNVTIGVSSGTAASTCVLASDGATTTATYGQKSVGNPGGGTTNLIAEVEVVLTTAQQVKYYLTGSNAQATITWVGWEY